MTTNEELFRQVIEGGFSDGNVSVIDEIAAPEFVDHQYGISPPDASGVKESIEALHRAFPDFSLTVEETVSSDETVWGRMTATGTHQGELGSISPTGEEFEITVIDIMRFKDGKLVEHWGVADRFAMMDQLGMRPPPKSIQKLMRLIRG